jgi:large subunit ribosomal protein L23
MKINLTDVLIRPIETEKTVSMVDKFTFEVHPKASKSDVKEAVKEFYGVEVLEVNVINLPEKTKVVGRGHIARKRAPFRKAIVTLKKGVKLDFNALK